MKPFERLDEAMNEQRLRLRLNWRQLAEAANISYTALRAIRRGDYRPTELTARGLDAALRWPVGTVFSLLDGHPLEGGQREETEQATEGRHSPPDQLALAQRLVAATVRELGLTQAEADEVLHRVRLEIEVTARSQEEAARPNSAGEHAS